MSDGTTDDIKGRVKEAAGDLTDDKDLKREKDKQIGQRARSRTRSTT